MFCLFLLTILGAAVTPSSAWARWLAPGEAAYAVNFWNSRCHVHGDGSYTVEVEKQIEILKDNARIKQGLARLVFNTQASKLELLEARTINPDRTTPVDRDHIVIKPLASQAEGFDQMSQLAIGFPDVRIGSRLYYKYHLTVSAPQIPGFFSDLQVIGWGEYVQKMSYHVDSDVPIFFETHDPDHDIEVQARPKSIDATLKAPVFRSVDEEDNAVMDPGAVPWLAISTAKDWSAFPASAGEVYEKVIGSKLPSKFDRIRERAKSLASSLDQINAVTSGIQDSLRYLGDWMAIQGAFYPRALATIAQSGYGDCKDFSVATAAILRRLGFDAHASWVEREPVVKFPPIELPALLHFNHTIVYARKDGREYWIDPTNNTSFAQGIYADIADRPAVVLGLVAQPVVKHIPPMSANGGAVRIRYHLRFGPDSLIHTDGEFSLEGRSSLSITGSGLVYSRQHLDYTLAGWLSKAGRVRSWKFGDYDVSSRIVKDLKIPFHLTESWYPVLTSAGPGYRINTPLKTTSFNFDPALRVSGLQLGEPCTWRREYQFSGRKVVSGKNFNCSGASQWMDYSRRFTRKGSELEVVDEIVTRKYIVPAGDIHSVEFLKLKDGITHCLEEAVVVFK